MVHKKLHSTRGGRDRSGRLLDTNYTQEHVQPAVLHELHILCSEHVISINAQPNPLKPQTFLLHLHATEIAEQHDLEVSKVKEYLSNQQTIAELTAIMGTFATAVGLQGCTAELIKDTQRLSFAFTWYQPHDAITHQRSTTCPQAFMRRLIVENQATR